MNTYHPKIITASAGTGKTYRLAVEYIALILMFFEHPDFKPDNILVLTFTKKATAEIRERIIANLRILLSLKKDESGEKEGLIKAIRKNLTGQEDAGELETREYNALFSAYRIISNDRRMLQVMTIDSYISSIFRNIIRPLRGIDAYELDTEAAKKRVPDILSHLMSPALKKRADKLLRRRISPSLDEYRAFFTSLIDRRWYYYLFTKRLAEPSPTSLQRLARVDSKNGSEELKSVIMSTIREFALLIEEICQHGSKDYQDHFNVDFKSILGKGPTDSSEMIIMFESLFSYPQKLYNLYKQLIDEKPKNMYNGQLVRKKELADHKERLVSLQEDLAGKLADYLIVDQLIPEQKDILDIWGSVLEEYDRLVYRHRNLSYDDISWLTFEALYSDSTYIIDAEKSQVGNEFYQFLSHRSRFILIDEFQDTSLIQFNILKPIIEEVTAGVGSKEFGGLVVVGDEKQSIFGWRGGERDLLVNLQRIIKPVNEVKTDKLDTSWRSSPKIMSFINGCFGNEEIKRHLNSCGMNWDYNEITSMKPGLDPRSSVEFKLANYSARGGDDTDLSDIYSEFIETMVRPAYEKAGKGNIAIICRKSRELNELQLMLETSGITGVFEPSQPITAHPLVKPLIAWLRFVAFSDHYSLLEFMRSDYIRLKAAPFKRIVNLLSSYQIKGIAEFSSEPLLTELWNLGHEQNGKPVSAICYSVMEEYLDMNNASERDMINLHAFLSVARDFEIRKASSGGGIPEFLRYLLDNSSSETLRQRSSEQSGTLQLMTIHKSKGLQFDTVLVFFNLSSRPGNKERTISHFMQYEGEAMAQDNEQPVNDFSTISDYAVTLHFEKLITRSKYRYLSDLSVKREQLEEMNNLYVAFTRAISNLGIFFTYQNRMTWDEYYQENLDKFNKSLLPYILCSSCRDYMSRIGEQLSEGHWLIKPEIKDEVQTLRSDDIKVPELADFNKYLALPHEPVWNEFSPIERSGKPPLKRVRDKDLSGLTGDLIHYYLSWIVRNTEDEHIRARAATLREYGSLISALAINELCCRLHHRLPGYSQLFDPGFDLIFCEKDVWLNDRVYRIDRLMVNTRDRLIRIVDYKTGGIYQPEQLQTYQKALQALDWVKNMRYTFSLEYVKIDVD